MLNTLKIFGRKYEMNEILNLFSPILEFGKDGNWKMILMWIIGGVLIYLAIESLSL